LKRIKKQAECALPVFLFAYPSQFSPSLPQYSKKAGKRTKPAASRKTCRFLFCRLLLIIKVRRNDMMELIKISDTKLKITLTAEDMTRYAIASEALNYENTETRRAVWQILDEAKQRTGFDAATDRVLIQAYPCRRGGCELYVTKIPGGAPATPRPSTEGRVRIFLFSALAELLSLCRALAAMDFKGESEVYLSPGEGYYLVLRTEGKGEGHLPPPYHPAQEFGETVGTGAGKLAYIREHASCLCPQDAVLHLSALA
jgi:negative regulator of genetic competence, sporulation and motility